MDKKILNGMLLGWVFFCVLVFGLPFLSGADEVRTYKHRMNKDGSYSIEQYRDGVLSRSNLPSDYAQYSMWIDAGNAPEIIAYVAPPIENLRAAKMSQFQGDYDAYINGKYPKDVREALLALYAYEGTPSAVKTNLNPIWSWINGLTKYYYATRDDIYSASNEAGIDAISWSFEFIDTDGEPADAWLSEKAYVVGEHVIFNSILYRCIQAGANQQPDISPAYWEQKTDTDPNIDPKTYLGYSG